jgi:hypothetical protein
MKTTFTAPIIFSTIILLNFLILQSFAQPRGMSMNQVYSQINKQTMNQQMQFMTQMQMANMAWRQNAGQGGSYYVTFKDSTQRKVVSYIYYDGVQRKNFLVFVDKKFPKSDSTHRFQKIYPEQTLSLSYGANEWVKYGFPTDSGWTFKVITGAISVYAKSAYFSEITKTPIFSAEVSDFSPAAIIGIQLNDGPMEKLTKETVLKMISQDPKAVALLEKRGMYDAVDRYNKDVEKTAKKQAPASDE